MRSKKDRDTVVIVTTDDRSEFEKLLHNNPNWEEIKKPELNSVLADGMPIPNRAERRGNKAKKKKRGNWSQQD